MSPRPLPWALALALAVACQPVAEPSEWPEQNLDVGGEDAGPAPVALTAELTGTWALATDWSTCVTIGKRFENRTRKLIRVEMSQQGHRVREIRRVCSIQTTPLLGLKTVIPPAVVQGIGQLEVDSLLFWSGPGQSYLGGVDVQLFGVKLHDPIADGLPGKEDLNDPRIVDSDGDGQPGATLLVGDTCKVSVVQRAISTLDGIIAADGWIRGRGMHATQQIVLTATSPICGTPFGTEPNDPHNQFSLVRVDKDGLDFDGDGDGDVSCAEIIAAQQQLISWREPDNSRCEQSPR